MLLLTVIPSAAAAMSSLISLQNTGPPGFTRACHWPTMTSHGSQLLPPCPTWSCMPCPFPLVLDFPSAPASGYLTPDTPFSRPIFAFFFLLHFISCPSPALAFSVLSLVPTLAYCALTQEREGEQVGWTGGEAGGR